MKPITPHYVALHLMKFPGIVKFYIFLLFYDYLQNNKIPHFPLPYSLSNMTTIPAVHHLIKSILLNKSKESLPTVIGNFFWNNISHAIQSKPIKKLLKKYTQAILCCLVLINILIIAAMYFNLLFC